MFCFFILVTQWVTVIMIAAALGVAYTITVSPLLLHAFRDSFPFSSQSLVNTMTAEIRRRWRQSALGGPNLRLHPQ